MDDWERKYKNLSGEYDLLKTRYEWYISQSMQTGKLLAEHLSMLGKEIERLQGIVRNVDQAGGGAPRKN